MNLYDIARPKLSNGRECWLRGHVAIASPTIWQRSDGQIELSMMLPLTGPQYAATQLHRLFPNVIAIQDWLTAFVADPETTCESTWDEKRVELRRHTQQGYGDDPLPRSRRAAPPAAPPYVEITF